MSVKPGQAHTMTTGGPNSWRARLIAYAVATPMQTHTTRNENPNATFASGPAVSSLEGSTTKGREPT